MKHVNRYLLGFLIILGATSLLFVFGDQAASPSPSAYNTKGLGMAAFVELLEQTGHKVVVDRSRRPVFRADDLVIYGSEQDVLLNEIRELDSLMADAVVKHGDAGGRAIELIFADNESSNAASSPTEFRVPGHRGRKFSIRIDDGSKETSSGNQSPILQGPFVLAELTTLGNRGAKLVINRGSIARNRFIGRDDNAEALVWMVDTMAKSGGRIVFAEATFGTPEQKGALDELGSWASAAWWQLIFIGAVIVYSVGRRFGLPTPEPYSQRGARELMGAVGDVLRRAKRHNYALTIIRTDAIHRLRNAYRMPAYAVEGDVLQRAPEELRYLLEHIRRLQHTGVTRKSAVETAQRVESLLQQIENEQKAERSLSE